MLNVEKCVRKHLKIINGIKFYIIIEFRKYTNLHENTYTRNLFTRYIHELFKYFLITRNYIHEL